MPITVAELCIKYLADISDIKSKLTDLDKTTQALQQSAKKINTELTGLAGTINNTAGILQSSIQAFAGLGLLSLAKNIAHTAGRADELQRVMYVVGNTAGYSRASMDKYETGIKKMGIATNEARESMTRMVQANLDLKYSTDLARAAQDLAVISGGNSSDTFQRMITNIQQMDTLGMRYMGIIVDRDTAEKKYAITLGVASSQLTKMQKTQAFMNATLEESKKLTGSYEEAMNSWTKTARSTERFVQNLQIVLGEGLQKPLLQYERLLQNTMNDMTKWNEGTLTGIGYSIGLSGGLVTLVSAFNMLKFALGATAPYVAAITAAIVALSFIVTDEGVKNYIEQQIEPLGESIKNSVLPPLISFRDTLLEILGISKEEAEETDWEWLKNLVPILGVLDELKKYRPTKKEKEAVYKETGVRDKKTTAEAVAKATTPEELEKEWVRLGEEITELNKLEEKAKALTTAPIGYHSLEAYKASLKDASKEKIATYENSVELYGKAIEDVKRKEGAKKEEKEYTTFKVKTGIQEKFLGIEKLETQKKQEEAYDEMIAGLEVERKNKTEKGLAEEALLYDKAIVESKAARTNVAANYTKMMEDMAKTAEKAPIAKLIELNKILNTLREDPTKAGFAEQEKDVLERIKKLSDETAKNLTKDSDKMLKEYLELAGAEEKSLDERLKLVQKYYDGIIAEAKRTASSEADFEFKKLAITRSALKTKEEMYEKTAKVIESSIKSTQDKIDNILTSGIEKAKKAKEDIEKWLTAGTKGGVADTRDAFEIAHGLRDVTGKTPEEIRADIEKLKELTSSLSVTERITLAHDYGEDIKKAAEKAELAASEIEAAPLKKSMEELKIKASELNKVILTTRLDIDPEQKNLAYVNLLIAKIAQIQGFSLEGSGETKKMTYSVGGVIKAAFGRYLSGYGGGDKIPVMAEAGEFVHRKEAVKHYGLDFMEALNSMKLPKLSYAMGGGISNTHNNSFSLSYNEGGVVPNLRIKDLMREIGAELKRESRRN